MVRKLRETCPKQSQQESHYSGKTQSYEGLPAFSRALNRLSVFPCLVRTSYKFSRALYRLWVSFEAEGTSFPALFADYEFRLRRLRQRAQVFPRFVPIMSFVWGRGYKFSRAFCRLWVSFEAFEAEGTSFPALCADYEFRLRQRLLFSPRFLPIMSFVWGRGYKFSRALCWLWVSFEAEGTSFPALFADYEFRLRRLRQRAKVFPRFVPIMSFVWGRGYMFSRVFCQLWVSFEVEGTSFPALCAD